MTAFFYIAGIVATIIGLVCFAIISYVYISVKYFDAEIEFGTKKRKKQ